MTFSLLNKNKKSVLVRGPVLTNSGYGVYSRQVARWLLEKESVETNFQLLPWGITPWKLDTDCEAGLVGKIIEKSNPPTFSDVTFQIQLPNEWDPNLGKFNVGITAAVETDICNPVWLGHINKMDHVIVLSEHTKKTLETLGKENIKTPISVVPLSYTDEIVNSPGFDILEDIDPSFNFLLFGQMTGTNPENDRKNLFYTIKWLCEEFSDDSDVGIIIKTNMGKNTVIDRQLTSGTLANLLREVRRGPYPRFNLIHGDLSAEEISSLYRSKKIKSLISLTRGEGFGLPILEAAVSGLPVIATDWSGHLDFMNLGKFIKIDYSLDEIHPTRVDNNIFMQGSRWANPSEKDFKEKIRKFRKKNDLPEEWAQNLSQVLVEKFSFKAICNRYDQILEGII